MGYAISWLGLKSPNGRDALKTIGVAVTDEKMDVPESDLMHFQIGDWCFLWGNRMQDFT